MIRRSLLPAAACWVLLTAVAPAETLAPRDQLIELASIEIAHELCGFDLSEAQADAITASRSALLDSGEVSEGDIGEINDQLEAALARQVPEGLCKAGGPGDQVYRSRLGRLGSR